MDPLTLCHSCLKKQESIKKLFNACSTAEDKYLKIIELGRALSSLSSTLKVPENSVKGCQSLVYLHCQMQDGRLYFEAASDALISSGLVALLLEVYQGETAEVLLKCPPTYLEELGISASLTPSRSNGLYSIHLRMKQEALRLLIKK